MTVAVAVASVGTRRGDKGDEDEDVDEDVGEDNVGSRWRLVVVWWRYQRRMVVVAVAVAGRVRLGVGVGERRRRLGPKRGVACVAEFAATYKRRGASTTTVRWRADERTRSRDRDRGEREQEQ